MRYIIYRLFIPIAYLIISCGYSYGQLSKSDSLKSLFLHQNNCKSEMHAIEDLVDGLTYSAFNTLNIEFKDYFREFNQEEDKFQFARYYYFMGYWHYQNNEDVDAIKCFLSGIEFIKENKGDYLDYLFNIRIANAYSRIGYYTQSTIFFTKGLTFYLNAIEILEKTNNNNTELVNLYAKTGHAYHGIRDTVLSDSFYKKSGKLAQMIHDNKGVARSLLNRGNLYFRCKQLEKAEQITKKALQYSDSISYIDVKIYSTINLCMINNSLGNIDEAFRYADQTYKTAQEAGLTFMLFRADQEKAQLYKKLGNYSKSAAYYKRCISNLDIDNDCFAIKKIYKELSEVYIKQKKFSKASFYQNKYIRINDSLTQNDFNKKVELAESLFEQESVVFENKLLDKENRLKKTELAKLRLISILAIISAILLIVLIVFETRAKNIYREQNKIIKEQSEEILSNNNDLNNYKENLEKLVADRTKELWDTLRIVQENNNLKNAFLRNISHEIRTPLNAIIGFTKLINSNNVDDIPNKQKLIDKNGVELLNTVEKIIEVAKIETEDQYLDLAQYTSKSVNKAIHTTINKIVEKGIIPTIDFKYSLTDFSGIIETDIDKLKRIIFHLVDNAFKFTKDGSILLKTIDNETHLEIIITDTGCGIAKDNVDLVFNPFHKIETKKQFSSGTGIGLTIVDRYVKVLKGEINIQSKIGKGTLFSVKIPKYLSK